ncbi:MAG: hypothetical protein Q9166_005272 [cf. Caloplaca sp. 2 TL-2023]
MWECRDNRDLTVNIDAIFALSRDGAQRTDLLINGISAFIDSTIPYIYLPLEACKKFEAVFGITWNQNVQAYLVNDTLHDLLVSQNTSITFTLSNSTYGSGSTVDITLPYAAFDLIAESPLVRNTSRYFPLMRAANESQYTLGRTFFQEAYVIADYERRNFSVSQCSWVDNAQQEIVPIPELTTRSDSEISAGLSSGAMVGISIGSIAAVSTLAFALYLFIVRPLGAKRSLRTEDKTASVEISAKLDVDERPQEIDGKAVRGRELDSKPYFGQELDGKVHSGNEMEGSRVFAQELGTKGLLASELPA